MKKLLFLILITINALGQSITISPNNTQSLLHIKKGISGVGVFNSNANLHIESNVNNYISLLTPNAIESGVLFGNPTSTADGGIIYNAGNAKGLQFRTNNNVTRMTLDGLGNMGIGATNPFSKLDIQGSLYRTHFFYDTSEDTYIRGGKGASRVIINDIAGMGNVGIGTNNPQAKLHISQGNLRVDALAGSGIRNLGADASGNLVITNSSNSPTIAFSAGTTGTDLVYDGTETQITLNYEFFDVSNNFDPINYYRFDAPSDGVYHFTINLVWEGNANGYRRIVLRNGVGTYIRGFISFPSNANPFSQTFSCDEYLTQGSGVTLYAFQNSGSNLNIYPRPITLVYEPIFMGFKVK